MNKPKAKPTTKLRGGVRATSTTNLPSTSLCNSSQPSDPVTPLLKPFNASLGHRAPLWNHRNLSKAAIIAAHCTSHFVASVAPSPPPNAPPITCADYTASTGVDAIYGHVQLLLGIVTGPSNKKRRDAVRETWLRWPSIGRSVVVCFVIGRKQVAGETLAALDLEQVEHRDLLFLPEVSDGCVKLVSIGKAYGFWRAAANLVARNTASLPPLPSSSSSSATTRSIRPQAFIAKADDDSFVDVPHLERHLGRLFCAKRAYFGALAFTGYLSSNYRFLNCGFAWAGGGAYKNYGCEKHGAHPPFPFALGQLQVMSAEAASALAESRDAQEFAAAAEALPNINANEDSAIGLMMSRVPRVAYVNLPKQEWHNLGCWPSPGLYRPAVPNGSLVVHRIKSALGLKYVWGVMGEGKPNDIVACVRAALLTPSKQQPLSPQASLWWVRKWCEKCTIEGQLKRHPGNAPEGCKEVSQAPHRIRLLRESCDAHGLLPKGLPPLSTAAEPAAARNRTRAAGARGKERSPRLGPF